MSFKRSGSLLLICFFALTTIHAKPFIVSNNEDAQLIGAYCDYLEDETAGLSINDVIGNSGFIPSEQEVPNFNISKSAFWLKVDVTNELISVVSFHLKYPQLDQVSFYKVVNGVVVDSSITGEIKPIPERNFFHQDFIYNLNLDRGQSATYYIRVVSDEQILVPILAGANNNVYDDINSADILNALYMGIILVMFLYNLFVFFTVRDKSYLYYVVFILFVGLTQLGFAGYTYRFLWPGFPWLANQSVILFPAITGIAAIEFFKNFLQVKSVLRKSIYVLNFLNIFYLVNCILSLTGNHQLSQQLMQPNAMIASFTILGIAIYLLRKGSRSAGFFILAWSVFLAGIILFILKDVGVLPYNNFTNYILHIGSAVEVVVLSFALGDRINILRKEKEESQKQALHALEENAKIISEQNILLETKVNERTKELTESNDELNKTLRELKEAESQLVESEKMASLGQLTAGIAHEINNPINFVTSNVKPLKRDVDMIIDMLSQVEAIAFDADMSVEEKKEQVEELKEDLEFDYLKDEISYLLKGITEGSDRTAEIVKGLRVFSRLDEDDLKLADINEGIDSTLVIVRNTLGTNIEIEKNYGNIPLIECYPGKLNQVFLNIISNGMQAIASKFKGEQGGVLTITTERKDDNLLIRFADNGIGMDENTKKKVFEPFFTTKDVGEGTGLGMSIVYNTVNKHNGKIELTSELGKGTEFVISIPIKNDDINEEQIGEG